MTEKEFYEKEIKKILSITGDNSDNWTSSKEEEIWDDVYNYNNEHPSEELEMSLLDEGDLKESEVDAYHGFTFCNDYFYVLN